MRFSGMRSPWLPLLQQDQLVQCLACKRTLLVESFETHQVATKIHATISALRAPPTNVRRPPASASSPTKAASSRVAAGAHAMARAHPFAAKARAEGRDPRCAKRHGTRARIRGPDRTARARGRRAMADSKARLPPTKQQGAGMSWLLAEAPPRSPSLTHFGRPSGRASSRSFLRLRCATQLCRSPRRRLPTQFARRRSGRCVATQGPSSPPFTHPATPKTNIRSLTLFAGRSSRCRLLRPHGLAQATACGQGDP